LKEIKLLYSAFKHIRKFISYGTDTQMWTNNNQLRLATGHWGFGKFGGNVQSKCNYLIRSTFLTFNNLFM
jgi:hypothetical protein